MSENENRRYPRIPHVTSRQIVRLDGAQTPQKNVVLTKNLSACGIKFTTNERLHPASYFLVYLNEMIFAEHHQDNKNLLKSGNFYLAQVVWSQEIANNDYEIGAAFLEKHTCKSTDIETFTELVNVSMLDSLPESSQTL